jgi:hypothetical protein
MRRRHIDRDNWLILSVIEGQGRADPEELDSAGIRGHIWAYLSP